MNIGWLEIKICGRKKSTIQKNEKYSYQNVCWQDNIFDSLFVEKLNATFNNISVILGQSKNWKLRHSFYKWFNQIVFLIVKKNRLAIDKY